MSLRFANTSCSQCGRDLGPGNAGTSHCDQHARTDIRNSAGTTPLDIEIRANVAQLEAERGREWAIFQTWLGQKQFGYPDKNGLLTMASGDLDDLWTAWSGRAELVPGFSPMCLAPLDGTPVMLYMPTTGDKFAVGQWHGSPDSLHGNWGDDEGNYYVHEPVCFMALSNLERLVQPSYKAINPIPSQGTEQ